MSTKRWIKGKRGMYVKVPTRGARAGKTCYWARVWIKSQGRFAHFYLGIKVKASQDKMDEILGDPEAALAKRETQRQDDAVVHNFEQVLDLFLADYEPRGGKDSVYYRENLGRARAFMGKRPITEITSADLDDYVKACRAIKRQKDGGRRVSDSTIRKHLIALGTLFKWAQKRGHVPANIADGAHVDRPDEQAKEARALTDAELVAVREGSAPWLDNVIGWAAETGMDKGKILRLRWAELDLDHADRRITAGRFTMSRDKTGVLVRQVLSAGAIEVLNRAAKVRHTDGTVFLDADAQPVQEKALDWALGTVYKNTKIAGCNFRTFRHTFATRALRRGVPVPVLAKMMGHSNAYITARYMHVLDDQLEAAALAMSGPEVLVHGRGRGTIPPVPGIAGAPPTAPPAVGSEAGIA